MTVPQQQAFPFAPAERAAARQHNVVIEAGAGTGKTTAIAAEVLKRLIGPEPVAPERIVLVTFTEKAAGEIGRRIEQALQEIAVQLESGPAQWPAGGHSLFEIAEHDRERVRHAVARQLERIDRLRSQTIHSFCQTLLRQFPIEAGIDPQFRIIEGFERSLLYEEIYDDWIDDETRQHPRASAAEEWEALLDHYGYLFLVANVIFSLVDRRHLLLETRYSIGSISEIEVALYEAIDDVARHSGENRIAGYFKKNAPPPPGSDLEAWLEFFAPAAVDLRAVKLKDFRGGKEGVRTLRGEKPGSCIYDFLISHRAAAALRSLTRRFVARLDEEKRVRGVLDFDDLLLCTRRLLDHPGALERIRQQFDCIFVDEFQDTDRVQAEIIERLARDRSGAWVPGKTVVVGDPKQSIYAFRRADPETYGAFTKVMRDAGAEPRILRDQHRSTPALVNALNAIGTRLFELGDRNRNVFRPEYHQLEPALPARDDDPIPLTFLGCDGGAGDRSMREAEAIASWMLGPPHEDWKRFALLFRRRTNIDDYLEVFDRRGIPYVVPPMGGLLEHPASVDLVAVLRAIAYRYDRGAAISAARSPYFALSDPEIAAGLLRAETEPWRSFAATLESFREVAGHCTVSGLIDHVIETTGIEAVYREARDVRQPLRSLEQLRAIAFFWDRNDGGSVRQFVEEITRRRELPEENEPTLLDDTTNAVRILTIHGAKGLQFDTVILPDIEFHVGGNSAEFFTVEDPPSLVIRNGLDTLSGIGRQSDGLPLRDVAKLRDEAESARLFYVAMTRAESRVVIVCDPSGKISRAGFGKYVQDIFDMKDGSRFAEEGSVVHDIPICGALVPVAFERVHASGPQAAGTPAGAAPPLPECIVPVPAAVAETLPRSEMAIARAASANRLAGTLLHRVLERWDGSSDVAALVGQLAVEQAADGAAADLVLRRLAVVRESAMFRRILAAETIGREMPVHELDESGAVVERRIDRLIREAGSDLVIDYKSGAPTEPRLAHDRDQVARYCRLVERLTGRPCSGALWYIDVENDKVVPVPE
ncbi:MAG TPA: UvrD-helicase domain-containing protein [Thermoanaerobaculia bacterium]|nr:UvrD-helicase domain-containing protein [Thermoanaerobaculia bacterium]